MTFILILGTNDGITILDKVCHAGLFENLYTVWVADGEVLETFELSISDDHSRELSATTVGTRLRVAAQARDLGEIEAELRLEPVDGIGRATREDLNQIVASEVLRL